VEALKSNLYPGHFLPDTFCSLENEGCVAPRRIERQKSELPDGNKAVEFNVVVKSGASGFEWVDLTFRDI